MKPGKRSNNKYDILLSGVGGIGILTASRLITDAARIEGKNVIMSEIHGLSQRGGMVYTMVRLGEVVSPLIKKGGVDTLIALEVTESMRYLEKMDPNGTIIVNDNLVVPPIVTAGVGKKTSFSKIKRKLDAFSDNVAIVPALKIAEELGNPIVQNVVLIGAFFAHVTSPLAKESGKKAIKTRFNEKGEKIVDLNLQAFERGLEIGQKVFRQ